MNLEDIILSKIKPSQKNTVLFYLYEIPRIVKFIETESKMVTTGSWGSEAKCCCSTGKEFQFYKLEGVLRRDGGDGFTV